MKKDLVFFVVWFVTVSAPLSILMAQHNLSFKADARMESSGVQDKFLVTHILGSNCKCSNRIARYLVETQRPSEIAEKIVVVGGLLKNEMQLQQQGFTIEHISVTELKSRFNLVSAPVLLIKDKSGVLKYSGGYKNIDEVEARDIEILKRIENGNKVAALPVMGCALTDEAKAAIDPFNFKYAQ
jgi:thioredoxin-related protein